MKRATRWFINKNGCGKTLKTCFFGYPDLDTTLFLSQTKQTTKLGLRLGTTYELGGRDALIIANFISNSIEKMGKELEILLPDKG